MAQLSVYLTILSVYFFLHSSEGLDDQPGYKSLSLSWGKNALIADVKVDSGENVLSVPKRYRRQVPPSDSQTPADTVTIEDDHDYYTSKFYSEGQEYFQNLGSGRSYHTVDVHEALSDSHLTAGEVQLPFQFPFYGHNITKVYIATGGFLSLSTFFHQYLSATQYIAPLMGNFDPSLNATSKIRYGYNATAFTVEWDNLHVQHIADAGRFTFQTTLIDDGRILFAYKQIPRDVNDIGGGNGHKVTVGLSDGYYIDEPLYPGSNLVRRTIYHYHNIQLNKTLVIDDAAFVLIPLKTCNLYTNCSGCLSVREEIRFDCGWCDKIKRCSSGIDRHRQDWIEAECSEEAQEECYYPAATVTREMTYRYISRPTPQYVARTPWSPTTEIPTSTVTSAMNLTPTPQSVGRMTPTPQSVDTMTTWSASNQIHNYLARAAIIIVIVIVVVIALALIGCLVYAYKNPSSRSGQQLVQIQQRVRHLVRRNPRDNYEESIVGNMQEAKPTPPPAYSPSQDSPAIPTPPMSGTPSVITTTGAPGATTLSGNGDVAAGKREPSVDTGVDPHAQTAEC